MGVLLERMGARGLSLGPSEHIDLLRLARASPDADAMGVALRLPKAGDSHSASDKNNKTLIVGKKGLSIYRCQP